MKIEQLNANAKVRHIDDTMVELGLPEVAPIALAPGVVSRIRTGVKLVLESEEAAIISFTQPVAETGVTLAHPSVIVESSDGEFIISVFNRSSFMRTLEPDKPLCCVVSVARGAKIVGETRKLIDKAVKVPDETLAQRVTIQKPADTGAIGAARKLIRNTLSRKKVPADAA